MVLFKNFRVSGKGGLLHSWQLYCTSDKSVCLTFWHELHYLTAKIRNGIKGRKICNKWSAGDESKVMSGFEIAEGRLQPGKSSVRYGCCLLKRDHEKLPSLRAFDGLMMGFWTENASWLDMDVNEILATAVTENQSHFQVLEKLFTGKTNW